MQSRGLTERHLARGRHERQLAALPAVAGSQYGPAPGDRGAHRHRRYGAGTIYLKLRQEGRKVNHKRVDRELLPARWLSFHRTPYDCFFEVSNAHLSIIYLSCLSV